MVDYTKSTGSSGTMMIRDTGSIVEFWLKAGSATFSRDIPWGYTVNGSTSDWRSFDFQSGGDWQKLRSWTVSTSQTVTFRLGDTGTSGLGGPTTLSATINRASVPSPPSTPNVFNITATSAQFSFTDGANNGAPIDAKQLGYGTNSSTPVSIIGSGGANTVGGLTPGRVYYAWARTHNSVGWSAWSGRRQFTTLNVPSAPSAPSVTNVTQVSATVNFNPTANGGSPITGYEVGYGTNVTTPTTVLSATSPKVVGGLTPGAKYYFRVRAKNAIGVGPWSSATAVTTIAGMRVLVDGTWKVAVPYVNVKGVWKLARPWGRKSGIWIESS